jgi:hypothetical protein
LGFHGFHRNPNPLVSSGKQAPHCRHGSVRSNDAGKFNFERFPGAKVFTYGNTGAVINPAYRRPALQRSARLQIPFQAVIVQTFAE